MYAKVTGSTVDTFPYTIGRLKRDNPSVSFTTSTTLDDVAQYGVVPVTQQADPAFNAATQRLEQGVPVLNGGAWEVTQVSVLMTQEQQDIRSSNTARQEDLVLLRADAQVAQLLKARPAGINNYIENNVSNMAEAKEVLKIFGRALAVLAHTTLN
jgi:hypothetical protein